MRKTYFQLTNKLKIRLKESWNSNGSLEDFDPESLVKKAFDNKYATNSIREFKDKLLYINVDPGFVFGQRTGSDKIWVSVVEMDKDDTSNQNRIYLESTLDEQEAVDLLNQWKTSYMNGEVVEKPVIDEEPPVDEEPSLENDIDGADIQDIMDSDDNPDEGEL